MTYIESALLSMGYRRMKINKWGKPIGFQLLLYEEDKNLISSWFGREGGEYHIWNTDNILADTEEEMIRKIKVFEVNTRLNMNNGNTNFEFLTFDQILNL